MKIGVWRHFLIAVGMFGLVTSGSARADFAYGYVDSMTATPGGINIVGWVCRIWYPEYTYLSTIEIYEDGVAGSGTLVASFHPPVTGSYRPDTSSYCGSSPYNGFSSSFYWSNPAPYRSYYVYIRDDQTNALQLLNPAPFVPTY